MTECDCCEQIHPMSEHIGKTHGHLYNCPQSLSDRREKHKYISLWKRILLTLKISKY